MVRDNDISDRQNHIQLHPQNIGTSSQISSYRSSNEKNVMINRISKEDKLRVIRKITANQAAKRFKKQINYVHTTSDE